jgi:tRNA (guanine37-N1)-methyltransferase
MKFSILTIFPEIFSEYIKHGLLSKAIEKKLVEVDIYDLRDFSNNKHNKVDDRPFGGGAGMVMTPEPFFNAVEKIKEKNNKNGRVILFSAYAPVLTQKKAKLLADDSHLILICGRYEGIDQRIIDNIVDEELSIGDYVLMGGEVAAEVLIETVIRMKDGVIGNKESVETDSFYIDGQYGFPQYTQPRNFRGLTVPDVLLSGHHKDILDWRRQNQKKRGK